MGHRHTLALLALALILLPAASTLAQGPQQKTQPAQSDRIAELERLVKALQSRINTMDQKLAYPFASLDCNSKKYVEFRLENSRLVFFAICKGVEPYLEGHKVLLSVGNPHAFNFSGVKGKLGYGKTVKEALYQEVEISTTETLRAGSWHSLTVIVNPSKAEDMRILVLELTAETAIGAR
jgi:hypothetical protein